MYVHVCTHTHTHIYIYIPNIQNNIYLMQVLRKWVLHWISFQSNAHFYEIHA